VVSGGEGGQMAMPGRRGGGSAICLDSGAWSKGNMRGARGGATAEAEREKWGHHGER
jgi:hypothetical protein